MAASESYAGLLTQAAQSLLFSILSMHMHITEWQV